MRIAVFNNKGGVGKSTLAVHIAFMALQSKKKVLFIDADQQQNGISWVSKGNYTGEEVYEAENLYATTELSMLEDADDFDITLIDCPPEFNFMESMEGYSIDHWIIPVSGRFSVDGLANVCRGLKASDRLDENQVVVNSLAPIDNDFRKVQVEEIKKFGMNLYAFSIPLNDNFRKGELDLVPVWDVPYAKRSGAVQSLIQFCKWVVKGFSPVGYYGGSGLNVRSRRARKWEVV